MTARADRPNLSPFFAALFTAVGLYLPYFPLWLAWKGLDAATIGLVLTAPMVVRLLAMPFLGAFADRFARPAVPLRLFALAATGAFALLFLADSPIAIAAAVAVAGAFWGALVPVSDAIAVRLSRAGGPDYGRVRIAGSAAFIAANLGGGALLSVVTDAAVLPLVAAAFAGTLAASLALRIPPGIAAGGAETPAAAGATRRFLLVAVAAGLVQASHGLVYAFGSIWWEGRGFSPTAIGALWATGVVAEIVLFRFGARVLARITPLALVAIGAAGAIVRWSLMAAEPGLVATFALQALHGLSFGATHLGLVHFIGAAVPARRAAAAQSLAATVMGVFMAATTASSGVLFERLDALAFLAMAALAAAALVAAGLAARAGRWRRGAAGQPQSAGGGGERTEPS